MKTTKKIIYIIWILVVVSLLALFIISPTSFTPEAISEFICQYESQLLIIYTVICIVRGLFLIPSTPFVLAGVLIFPDQPWAVFLISIIGVLIGSSAVYYFSDLLGFSKKLEEKYPKKIEAWHRRLNSPRSMLIVIAWSFFPLVPTDIICYVAGIVKMPYKYLMLGVAIGEVVLISAYIWFGNELLNMLG